MSTHPSVWRANGREEEGNWVTGARPCGDLLPAHQWPLCWWPICSPPLPRSHLRPPARCAGRDPPDGSANLSPVSRCVPTLPGLTLLARVTRAPGCAPSASSRLTRQADCALLSPGSSCWQNYFELPKCAKLLLHMLFPLPEVLSPHGGAESFTAERGAWTGEPAARGVTHRLRTDNRQSGPTSWGERIWVRPSQQASTRPHSLPSSRPWRTLMMSPLVNGVYPKLR